MLLVNAASTEVAKSPIVSLMPEEAGRMKSAKQRFGLPGITFCWRNIGTRVPLIMISSPSLLASHSAKTARV